MMSTQTVIRLEHGKFHELPDQLAVEEPLQIQLLHGTSGNEQTTNIAVTMRTPGNDEELAAGFLFTEGIVSASHQLVQVIASAGGENTVLAILRSHVVPILPVADRNFYISSSCGICGKASIDAVRNVSLYPLSKKAVYVAPHVLQALPARLRDHQSLFQSTGGLHACALFDKDGAFIMLREDIGRHNALDKLIGAAFMDNRLPLHDHILLLSGRASFELVQKAAVAGIRIIAAIGAPSTLAVQLAQEAGITLVGFLKSNRFNIYSGKELIIETQVPI